jgi:hypothetical protein
MQKKKWLLKGGAGSKTEGIAQGLVLVFKPVTTYIVKSPMLQRRQI